MQKRWITVKEAASYLSLHEVTCRRLIAREIIPASRIGGSVRIDLKELEKQLEKHQKDGFS